MPRDPDFFKLHYRQWRQRMHKMRVGYDLQGALLAIVIETHLTGSPPANENYVLAGCMMVSPRKARAAVDRLEKLGLVRIEDGLVVDKTAVEDAAERSELRAIRAQSGREGGVRSGVVRRDSVTLRDKPDHFASDKSMKIKETDEAKPKHLVELEKSRVEVKEEANASSKKRGTRIPPDWHISPALLEWTEGQGLSEAEACLEADQFRDYWRAATRNATKLDWDATWRTWIRNHNKRKPQQRRNGDDRTSRIMQMADGIDRRAEAEGEMDSGTGDGDAVAFLPAGAVA